jgi:hypothetical protein
VVQRSVAKGRKGLSKLLVGGLVCASAVGIGSAGAQALAPGWGYELVSPANAQGADVDFGAGSADGNHAWVAAVTPLVPDSHTGNIAALAATRTSTGWKLRELADVNLATNYSFQVSARSADSSRTVVQSCPETLVSCNGFVNFERIESDGSRTTVVHVAPFNLHDETPSLAASSDDLSTLFVHNPSGQPPLLPEDTHTQGRGLYASDDGQLSFIGYDENGNVLPCGAGLANGKNGTGFQQSGISANGDTAIFESPDPTVVCSGPIDVYLRRAGQSVNISAPRIAGHTDQGATFLGNSRNGNTVYILTSSQLDPSDTDTFADIYAYDAPSDTITPITSDANVLQAVVSPQGDYVYFSATRPIAGEGTNGQLNLYLYHDGTIQYITTPGPGNYTLGGSMGSLGMSASPLTPDGTHLLFLSAAEFTSQPLNGTIQLFQYDQPNNTFTCISCPPDGSLPTVDIAFPGAHPAGNSDQRFQSDDGHTIVFETEAQLLPQDVNTVFDVYMWHDGTLSLASDGHSQRNSILESTDAAGHNVFFRTNARLTPQDDQDTTKLYDARLGGGFPLNPPTPPCTDDSCQPPLTDTPTYTPSGSETFTGPGNQTHHAAHTTKLTVVALTAAARRQLLHTGHATLKIHTNKPGKLRVRVTTTSHGHRRILATLTRTIRKAGTIRIGIHLTHHARTALHAGATVRFAITLNGHTINRTAKLPT